MKFGIEIVVTGQGFFDVVMYPATQNSDTSTVSATREELIDLRDTIDEAVSGRARFQVEFE